ncbi:MAG: hypothetical protein ACKVI4_16720, partial [Actinomycetales bacterium]
TSYYPTHPVNVRSLEPRMCGARFSNLAWAASSHGDYYNDFPTSGCFYAHAGSEASARAGYKTAGAPILNTIARMEGCVMSNAYASGQSHRATCALAYDGCHQSFEGSAPTGSTWRQYSDIYPGEAWCVPYWTTTGYDIHGAVLTGTTSFKTSVAACEADCDAASSSSCSAVTWNRATMACTHYQNAFTWDRYATPPEHVAWSCGKGMLEYAWRNDDTTCNHGGNLPVLSGATTLSNEYELTWQDVSTETTFAAFSFQGSNTLNGFRMGGPWGSSASQLKTFRVTLYDRPVSNDTTSNAFQRTAAESIPDDSHIVASEEFYGTCYSHDGHDTVDSDGVDHGVYEHPYEPWRRCVDGSLMGQSDFDKHVYHFSKAYPGVKSAKIEPLTTWIPSNYPGIREIEFGYYTYGPHDTTSTATLAAASSPPPPPPPTGRCDADAKQVRGYSGKAPLMFGSVRTDTFDESVRTVEGGEHSCSDAASQGWDMAYELPTGDDPYEIEIDVKAYEHTSASLTSYDPTVYHLPGAYQTASTSAKRARCFEMQTGSESDEGMECRNAYVGGTAADCAEWGADGTVVTDASCNNVGDGLLETSPSLVYEWPTTFNLTGLHIDNEPSVYLQLFGKTSGEPVPTAPSCKQEGEACLPVDGDCCSGSCSSSTSFVNGAPFVTLSC